MAPLSSLSTPFAPRLKYSRRTLSHRRSENSWCYRETFNVFSQAPRRIFDFDRTNPECELRSQLDLPLWRVAEQPRRQAIALSRVRGASDFLQGKQSTANIDANGYVYSTTWRSCARVYHRAHERASTYVYAYH